MHNVDTEAAKLPVHLRARLWGSDVSHPSLIAISLNGSIVAVTRTYEDEDATRLQAMIPALSLIDGANTLELAVVSPSDSGWVVSPIGSN